MRLRPPSALAAAVATAAVAVPLAVLAPLAQGAEGTPDLVWSPLTDDGFEPGTVHHQSVTITNEGTATARDIVFRTTLTRGLDFPGPVAGCSYGTDADQVKEAVCHLDKAIAPGASTKLSLPVKVLDKALFETIGYGTSATGADPGDSLDQLTLRADNTADLQAAGDKAAGAPGDTVDVTATLKNNGPGWVRQNASDDQAALLVNIPKGTTAVDVPGDCTPFHIDGPSGEPGEPGKPQYVCAPSDYTLDATSSYPYTFGLKIGAGTEGTAKGSAKATSVYDIDPDYDADLANNEAPITVDVQG
ncbi:hypothetical protein [Streptomyces sp. NPDC050560]|uniref:hypothetical protein n=1 Tax=Streptomyces sp. NPDC050560 TaxID=3365630 RepID=UPI003799B471